MDNCLSKVNYHRMNKLNDYIVELTQEHSLSFCSKKELVARE